MFYVFSTLLYVHSRFVIILMRKRELVALLSFTSWCLVVDVLLFLAVPWVSLQFVIVVIPDHTHFFQSSRCSCCKLLCCKSTIKSYVDDRRFSIVTDSDLD